MTADLGRAAVYAAEIAAFEGTSYESITPFAELVGLGRLITAAPWWPHADIEIVPARSDASSSWTRQRGSGPPVVRLASPQMTPATVVHELAHVLAGVGSGHGELFRRAHVDLVGYAFGDEPATWLVDAYRSMGLAPGTRRWLPPPIRREAGGPVAL
jgi:hypothetical protein